METLHLWLAALGTFMLFSILVSIGNLEGSSLGEWIFKHRWGKAFFLLVVPLILFQIILFLFAFSYFRTFFESGNNGNIKLVFPSFAITLPLWPIFLHLWFIRDQIKEQDFQQARLALAQEDFHKIQEWAAQSSEDTNNTTLRVAAIHQLERYLTGNLVGLTKTQAKRFQLPTLELYKSIAAHLIPEQNIDSPIVGAEGSQTTNEKTTQKDNPRPKGDGQKPEKETQQGTTPQESGKVRQTQLDKRSKHLANALGAVFRSATAGGPITQLKEHFEEVDFSGLNLRNTNFSRSNFDNATLRKVDFSNATLCETQFYSANLSGGILTNADLSGANLFRANLSRATLTGADFSDVKLTGAKFTGAKFNGAKFNGADLSGADLPGADLSGTNLSGTNLSGANLNGANLNDADLSGANLSNANLSGTNLSSANLFGANLSDSNLFRATLTAADFSYAKLTGANLNGANLTGANLSNADISRADLLAANLSHANISGADLTGANLFGTDLSDANLSGADLSGIDLWEDVISFEGAHIFEVRNAPEGFRKWALSHGAIEEVPSRK